MITRFRASPAIDWLLVPGMTSWKHGAAPASIVALSCALHVPSEIPLRTPIGNDSPGLEGEACPRKSTRWPWFGATVLIA